MSDLISRSALLEEFKRELERGRANDPFFDGTLFHYTGIKAIIENQPTAYNVEQVVKELERRETAKREIAKEYLDDFCFEMYHLYDNEADGIKEAIEIVKEVGGINEHTKRF